MTADKDLDFGTYSVDLVLHANIRVDKDNTKSLFDLLNESFIDGDLVSFNYSCIKD